MEGRFLILGRAGSGKTRLILEKWIDFLKQNREDEVIFLLSTSSQVEHLRDQILKKGGISGFFDQNLFTFTGLSEKILESYSAGDLISELEKDLILTEILQDRHFDYFKPVRDFPGFKRALINLIREIKENMISPSRLESLLLALDRSEKTRSIVSIYQKYCRSLKERGRFDQEDFLKNCLKGHLRREGRSLTFGPGVPSQSLRSWESFLNAPRSSGEMLGDARDWADLETKNSIMVGSPETVRKKLWEFIEDAQVGNLLIQFQFGNMKDELARKSMRLFATEVAPALRRDSAELFGREFPMLADMESVGASA